LMTYSRLLNPNDEDLLAEIREYRNQIVDVDSLRKSRV
jgi:hypothetical protein